MIVMVRIYMAVSGLGGGFICVVSATENGGLRGRGILRLGFYCWGGV